MSNTSIQLKKSGITGNTPGDLQHGEVAINYADGKLYYKDGLDGISYINNQDSFATINVHSTLLLASSPTDTLTIVGENNVLVSACTATKTITIGLTGSTSAHANAAYDHANSAYLEANSATILAQGAFDKANTVVSGGGFPVVDLGFVYETVYSYDMLDLGVLS
jgi:hypothetical protein